MAIAETLLDLLSATSGALVGATVTALFNHGKRRQLSDQVVLGQRALDKMQAEKQKAAGVDSRPRKHNLADADENFAR